MRFINLPAIDKKIPLGTYVRGIKKAKTHLADTFPHGLTCWWPCTGKEIMEQFMRGVMDRINQQIPYSERSKY